MQQRHDDLGVHPGHDLDIARIGLHVVDEHRLLGRHGGAHQPAAGLQAHRVLGLGIADRVCRPQLPAALVEQVDRKRLERNQASDQAGNLLKEIVEVQHRRDLATQVEERREKLLFGPVRRPWRIGGQDLPAGNAWLT